MVTVLASVTWGGARPEISNLFEHVALRGTGRNGGDEGEGRPRRRLLRGAQGLTVLLAVSACDAGSVAIEEPRPIDPMVLATAEIQILSGDAQEGTVGEGLRDPLVVLVTDEAGDALPGAPVLWAFAHGKGVGSGNAKGAYELRMTTDGQGRSSVEWELGTQSGAQRASAEIPDAAPAPVTDPGGAPAPSANRKAKVEFKAQGKPAKAASIVFSQPSLSLTIGETADISAFVVDRYGNVIPDAVVRFESADPSVVTVAPAPASLVQIAEFTPPVAVPASSVPTWVGPEQ